MNLEERHKQIIEKYCLREEIEDLYSVEEYMNIWMECAEDVSSGSIALYGAGNHTKQLIGLLERLGQESKIGYIIDNYSQNETLRDFPIITEEKVVQKGIELIWISSWVYRDELLESIRKNLPQMKVIEPYRVLDERLQKREQREIWYYANEGKYKWFIKRQKRKKEVSEREKEKISRQLIAGYFAIFDWVDLEEEISRYVQMGYDGGDLYQDLLKDTYKLLKDISDEVRAKKSRNYFVYVVDALSKYTVDSMPRISDWKKRCTSFNNYRNEYPATRETIMGLLTGWHPFEDKTYQNRPIYHDSSKLLKYMKQTGIGFKFITGNNYLRNFRNINQYRNDIYENKILTEAIFHAVCELLKEDTPQVVIMHTYDTVHPPHLIPTAEQETPVGMTGEELKKFYLNAVAYTDKILGLYTKMFEKCENLTQIILGDHGKNIETEYAEINHKIIKDHIGLWDMETISPELMIYIPGQNGKVVDNLVSTNKFCEILYTLMTEENSNYQKLSSQYLPMEYLPGYNEGFLQMVHASKNYNLGQGLKGIMNKHFMYLSMEDGTQKFYRIKGATLVELNREEDINQLKSDLGEETVSMCVFPQSILEESFFDIHKKYYGEAQYYGSVVVDENEEIVVRNIDFEITEKCSLRCKDCNNCMQYYQYPENLSISRLKESLDILLKNVKIVEDLRILGGEPFLHPQLEEIVRYASGKHNVKKITIYTNATILPIKAQLEIFTDSKVQIFISDYGLKQRQKINDFEKICKTHHISYQIGKMGYWYAPGEIKPNHLSEQELRFWYRNCRGRGCATLLDGKVFQCEMLANATKIGLIPDIKENYVDLMDGVDLKKKLRNYFKSEFLPGCRWCNLTTQKIKPAIQWNERDTLEKEIGTDND